MAYRVYPVCVCVFGCVFVCVFKNRVRSITSSCMVGLENNLAQVIIMTVQYVGNKYHVAGWKVKVTVRTLTLWIGFTETCLCPTY